jgi:hypothetical protein
MVESGQSQPRTAVAQYGFSNSARVPLGLEVVRYAELTRRITATGASKQGGTYNFTVLPVGDQL